MTLKRLHIAILLGLPALAAASTAHAAPPQLPPAFKQVVDCRSIADQAQRLACYDARVAELEAAASRSDVVIVDRNQIRQTKRTLFGLPLPNLAIFGDSDGDGDGVSRLETTIRSVRQTGDGKWMLTLQEGGTWVQTDSRELIADPEAGAKVTVRRAALGSYLANVAGQPAIRVKRLQ
jgi:hypothetical protein